MSEPSLHELERDVEAARARLATDLATLRSPSTFSEFTGTLKAEALGTKDALVEKARSSVQSSVQGFIDELKAKAAANPGAVLAIGAGLAWRLIQRPPIASVLVGAGLYSLLRTPHGKPQSPYVTRAGELAGSLRERAGELGVTVREQTSELAAKARERTRELSTQAQQAATDLRERTAAAAQQVSQAVEDAREGATELAREASDRLTAVQRSMGSQASDRMTEVRDGAGRVAQHASGTWDGARQTASDMAGRAGHALDDGRDKILLGAAGLAVAAALGIALQRRAHGPADSD